MEKLHAGHRARLREQFLKSNPEAFSDHQLLELLLFYAIPRQDVNPLAHRLLKEFGSLNAVLSATEDELCAVEGIGPQTSALLRLFFELHRRLDLEPTFSQRTDWYLKSVEQAGRYALYLSRNDRYETLRLLCFDSKLRLLHSCVLATGSKNAVDVDPRKIIEKALFHHATSFILIHNHPSGCVLPSLDDTDAYHGIDELAEQLDLKLNDSLILGSRCVYSFRREIVLEYFPGSEVRTYSLSEYTALVQERDRGGADILKVLK
ncbi:MAG: DNA repair protein RadC [Clostridia bacterium]|nr:DNA repair protein RadC [Clostridia bacterium]